MLGRRYELILGKPVTFTQGVLLPAPPTTFNNNLSLEDQLRTTDGTLLVISQHHLDFKISKNTKGDLASATFTLYNPSPDTLAYLNSKSKQAISVVFKCGYEDNYAVAFVGTVSKTMHVDEGIEQYIRFICVDGEVQTKEAYTNRTFRKGTPITQVLDDLFSDMKLSYGKILIPDEHNKPIKKNIVVSGKTSEQLKWIVEDLQSSFYISDGKLNIIPKFEAPKGATQAVHDISSSSGMIGSPVSSGTGTDDKQDSPKNITQKTVKSLLLPFIKIGDIVTLTSIYNQPDNLTPTSDVYKVIAVQHTGNYEGEDWTTTLDIESTTGYRIATQQ
jgi:hypothetical protein